MALLADFVKEAVYKANVEHVTISLEYAYMSSVSAREAGKKWAHLPEVASSSSACIP